MLKMNKFNVVMETSSSTVVAEYQPLKRKSDSYQSEAELEKEFIKMENYILEVLRERKIKNLEKRIIEIEKKIK